MGNAWGDLETFDIDGIQGRHIVEYSEQRWPKGGMLPNYFFVGWCLGTPLLYNLVDFWRARESKCLMVLSLLESLKARRRLQWGLFFIGSLLCPKKDKSIHRRARPSYRGWQTSLPLVVQSGWKMLNLYWMDGHLDTFMSMNETKFSQQSFLNEKARKELNDNPWWAFS